ncbi:MAG: hypothetical protein KF745_07470 [Phycisphaeraceae bacterium]|nr:hypothetical protein [Phycisphaeraceae bacterium]
MKRLTGTLKSFLLAIAMLAVLAVSPRDAMADKLHLKDGRVLDGRVVREIDGHVYFMVVVGKIEHEEFFTKSQVDRIERDAPVASDAKTTDTAEKPRKGNEAGAAGKATKVAVLNFGPPNSWQGKVDDTVGIEITVKAWKDAVPLLEKDGVSVVVVRVNSGGGLGLEVGKFNDLFQDVYKKKFRTVAWIESAISAAAMSPYVLEEMYFLPEGNLGACTGWFGQLTAVKDLPLEQMLYQMEKASRNAGRNPGIMRSMQITDAPLSYSIDKETGEVKWFQDTSGDHVLNDGKHILTLNAVDAVNCKFARGVAATLPELMTEMGISEWELTGKAASDLIDESLRKCDETNKKMQEMLIKYRLAVEQAAQQQDRQRRGAEVSRARAHLNEIRQAIKVNPNFELLQNLTKEWFEEQEELLKRLMRP